MNKLFLMIIMSASMISARPIENEHRLPSIRTIAKKFKKFDAAIIWAVTQLHSKEITLEECIGIIEDAQRDRIEYLGQEMGEAIYRTE